MRKILLVGGLLLLAQWMMPAADAASDGRILLVAVDRSGERAGDLLLLSKVLREGIDAQERRIDVWTTASGVEAVIDDAERDKELVAALEQKFSGEGFALTTSEARTFWISPTAPFPANSDAEVQKFIARLETNILLLRRPLPDVKIEDAADGAIIRSPGRPMDQIVQQVLGSVVVVRPLSTTSWHVSWNKDNATGYLTSRPVAEALRYFLREPLDLAVQADGPGVKFTLTELQRDAEFAEAVRAAVAGSKRYALKEAPSVVLRLDDTRDSKAADGDAASLEGPAFRLMADVLETANPSVDITAMGDAVRVSARNPAHRADRAALILKVLAGHKDMVVTTREDQSLDIRLAPGVHLFEPKPPVTAKRLAEAIRIRADALKIRPVRVVAAGPELAKVIFAADTDAAVFRRTITQGSRLTLRLVDVGGEVGAAKPSPEAEKLPQAQGGFLWLKPGIILTGEWVAGAVAEQNADTEQSYVAIRLTEDGRAVFAAATRLLVGERIAIVVDGVVVTAPTVREPILGGKIQITGRFTPEEAKSLAAAIVPEQGSLPLRIADTPLAP